MAKLFLPFMISVKTTSVGDRSFCISRFFLSAVATLENDKAFLPNTFWSIATFWSANRTSADPQYSQFRLFVVFAPQLGQTIVDT